MNNNSEITCPEQLVNALSKVPDEDKAAALFAVFPEAFGNDPNFSRLSVAISNQKQMIQELQSYPDD